MFIHFVFLADIHMVVEVTHLRANARSAERADSVVQVPRLYFSIKMARV